MRRGRQKWLVLRLKAKGDITPTPEKEIRLVASRLRVQGSGNLHLLDPCCGKGEALRAIAEVLHHDHSKIQTYGVELEKERAANAGNVLDQVIQDGYENIRTEDKFSLLWLNPPYDNGFTERVETTFLRRLTNKSTNVLLKGGLLLFCIPQYVLDDAALLLASRFSNIKVYRFTDENYPAFKQVVVFATHERPDPDERKQTALHLREIAMQSHESLPSLEEADGVTFHLQPIDDEIRLFRAGKLHEEELAKDLHSSPVFQTISEWFSPANSRNAELKNPVLPLKPTHYALAIAAGAVGGNMGNHLLVGVTKQIQEHSDTFNDDGNKTGEVTIKHHKSIVRVFTKEGIFDLE
ncbi:hypothetical protein T458_05380 [Brevibacillus panacihumi W25]|uniref:DUF6094 domain-containing protein n=1 Tax=Brevibacillus panacihumi W25 TaxID=1408254 RepID=V6MCX8_9BACL|nr:DUF6094 domain-containing protein [Brevibacillus panacihumi]EST55760.1 hypothetical protein T458_05380 [Brevibacillus panacihumi W25]